MLQNFRGFVVAVKLSKQEELAVECATVVRFGSERKGVVRQGAGMSPSSSRRWPMRICPSAQSGLTASEVAR